MRAATITRNTAETQIKLCLNLDGRGNSEVKTGVGFLDHMLVLLAKHARFDLSVCCNGDTWVDDHHSVEDVGITLGQAFAEALGEKRGINRYGSQILPMDESLVLCAIDISGRDYLGYELPIPSHKIGTFDTELSRSFGWDLSAMPTAQCTCAFWPAAILIISRNVHLRQLAERCVRPLRWIKTFLKIFLPQKEFCNDCDC